MVGRWLRFWRIVWVSLYYGLDDVLLRAAGFTYLRHLLNGLFFFRRIDALPSVRLRLALEALGPLFVKFGQLLSTRRDLLPPAFAEELAKLQDQVPPFPHVEKILFKAYQKPWHEIFQTLELAPVASASVAQVHRAVLFDGNVVAVKILRPNLHQMVRHDLALMDMGAKILTSVWPEAKRLKPREVVAEFRKNLEAELDLLREGANASQLRRNFLGSPLLIVPKIFWDYSTPEVLVMEWMNGIPISNIDALRKAGINLESLAYHGVEIFFTQVFKDGFFHADMHPGNIFVNLHGQYIALDCGIVGTLSDKDKHYLFENFAAMARRNYRKVVELHIESGWAPKNVPIDELEAEIRTVSEPIFDKPLKDISLARILIRLFAVLRRHNISIQPQLILLQKTLFNVEGLGRQLYPDLDIWKAAEPFLIRWLAHERGLKGWQEEISAEYPRWIHALPELPMLVHEVLRHKLDQEDEVKKIQQILHRTKLYNKILVFFIIAAVFYIVLFTIKIP
jgi:ubiquinone biosynthesis protein